MSSVQKLGACNFFGGHWTLDKDPDFGLASWRGGGTLLPCAEIVKKKIFDFPCETKNFEHLPKLFPFFFGKKKKDLSK